MTERNALRSAQWDVGIIEIQHDLARHARMRFEEQMQFAPPGSPGRRPAHPPDAP